MKKVQLHFAASLLALAAVIVATSAPPAIQGPAEHLKEATTQRETSPGTVPTQPSAPPLVTAKP